MSIYDTEAGRKALEKVGFSRDATGDYPPVHRYGPMGSALAEYAMMDWLVEQWDNLAVERYPVQGWGVSILRPDTPHSLELVQEFIGSSATSRAEALIAAVLASKEKA